MKTSNFARSALAVAALALALGAACSGGDEPTVGADDVTPSEVGADIVATGKVEPDGSGVGGRGPLFDITSTETGREDLGGSLDQPPALTASAGAASLALGLGTYCWTPPAGPALCADAFGIITGSAALPASSGEAVTVSGAFSVSGASVVTGWAIPRPAEPLADGDDWLAWSPFDHDPVTLEIVQSGDELTFDAALPPGRYVVALFLDFTQGDASYGLLLDVQ